jgi:hypothetical protein
LWQRLGVIRRVFALGSIAAALACWAPDARADLPAPRLIPELGISKDKGVDSVPTADPWTTRPRTINLTGGTPGGPTGLAGLSFEYAPIKYLVLGAGGGWAPEGARAAFMPRFRLPLNHWVAIGIGAPFSYDPHLVDGGMDSRRAEHRISFEPGGRASYLWRLCASDQRRK